MSFPIPTPETIESELAELTNRLEEDGDADATYAGWRRDITMRYGPGARKLLSLADGVVRQRKGDLAAAHALMLAARDVPRRIQELQSLRDGWLDGKGVAPSSYGLEWFLAQYQLRYPPDLPEPRLYPTPEGGLRAEWSVGRRELSLDITLATRDAAWHRLDLDTDAEHEEPVPLFAPDGWTRLVDLVRAAAEDNQ